MSTSFSSNVLPHHSSLLRTISSHNTNNNINSKNNDIVSIISFSSIEFSNSPNVHNNEQNNNEISRNDNIDELSTSFTKDVNLIKSTIISDNNVISTTTAADMSNDDNSSTATNISDDENEPENENKLTTAQKTLLIFWGIIGCLALIGCGYW